MTVGSVFAWTAFLGPLLAITVPNALAPLLAIAVAGAAVSLWRSKHLPSMPAAPAILLGGIVVWGLISLFWSLEPGRGLVAVGRLGFMFFGALLLAGAAEFLTWEERRRIGKILSLGVFGALALLGVEVVFDGVLSNAVRNLFGMPSFQPFHLNRSATIMVVFLWPALMALRMARGARACIAGLIAGALVLTVTESATAALATAAAIPIAILGLMNRGTVLTRRLLMAGVLIGLLAAPAYSLGVTLFGHRDVTSPTVSSMLHRLYIWDFVAGRIREKPFLGWGLESSRAIPGGHTKRPLTGGTTATERLIVSYKSQLLPLHPHNAGLQIWLELGLPGILFFAGFLAWVLGAIGRQVGQACIAGLCMAQVASVFVIAELSYGVWQSWWVSTIALGAVFSVSLLPLAGGKPGEDTDNPRGGR